MTEKYAVIDLGSNSFRLEIGHFDGRKLVSDHYVKETVRLAAGFDSRGCLTEDTETRALASLARFGRLIPRHPAEQDPRRGNPGTQNREEFVRLSHAG